jgi:hypothetical protein
MLGFSMSVEKTKRILREPVLLLMIIVILSVGIVLAYSNMQIVQTEFDSYVESHHWTDSQYQALAAPKLIANLDHIIDNQTMDIWISGWVCNVGQYTAYNCRISIYGYTISPSYEIRRFVALGTIAPYNSTYVNTHVSYNDSAVLGAEYFWVIYPEWTNTP